MLRPLSRYNTPMANFDAGASRFRYLEDARGAALKRPGNERILKQGNEFIVEPMADLEGQKNLIPNALDMGKERIDAQLKARLQTGTAATVVEFLIDGGDGELLPDRRFSVEKGEIKENQYKLAGLSDALRSPETKALEILREAMQSSSGTTLLRLSPHMIEALRGSSQLSPTERSYFDTQLDSRGAKSALAQFKRFFGPDDSLAAAGVKDFATLVDRLNAPDHRQNLEILYDLARYPERFDQQFGGRDTELVSMAKTLKELPGFRRYPTGQTTGVPGEALGPRQKTYENALRTIKQYDYKVQISHGMQFNKGGVAAHDTQVDYRYGGRIFSLGFSGKDFDFSQPFQGGGIGFGNSNDAAQRLRLGYNSGSFDLRLGLARDRQGNLVVERPESEAAERYIARKGDEVKAWAKENMWITAGIAAAAAGGAYAYSLANPNQDLALDFNQRFDLLDSEFLRVKGEISPELHLKGGALDLGVRRVGLGASGNVQDHSYDASVRHYFTGTTIRAGEVSNEGTELSLRYGYRAHSMTLDNRYSYSSGQLDTQVGYQRNFVHSATMDSYVRPYAQLKDGTYQNSGITGGVSKDFGGGFQLQLNADYNQTGGFSGGFRAVKQF